MWWVLGVDWLESRRSTFLRTFPAQKVCKLSAQIATFLPHQKVSKLFEQLFAPIRSVHTKKVANKVRKLSLAFSATSRSDSRRAGVSRFGNTFSLNLASLNCGRAICTCTRVFPDPAAVTCMLALGSKYQRADYLGLSSIGYFVYDGE